MDRLPLLKQALIDAFVMVIRKAQRGYPVQGYEKIREAMLVINAFENFTVDTNLSIALIDKYLRELNNI